MNYSEFLKLMLTELNSCVSSMKSAEAEILIALILSSNKIICEANGRSGLQLAGFAMRLRHMGFHSLLVSEATCPAISNGDLLLIANGSGNLQHLKEHCRVAIELNAQVAVITGNQSSSLFDGTNAGLILNASAKYAHEKTVYSQWVRYLNKALAYF